MRHLILLLFCITSLSCQNYGSLKLTGDLPGDLKEVSGLEYCAGSNFLWAVNDSGNGTVVYHINKDSGKEVARYKLDNIKNRDWEDLTYAEDGRLFIGDFGNNRNDRKNLRIYYYHPSDLTEDTKLSIGKIEFTLEDQNEFPPKRKDRNFDIEAFFYMNDHLYLLSRNRASDFDGITKLYKLPAQKGDHEAKLVTSFKTCDKRKLCQVTSADYDEESNTVALLSYDKVWLLTEFSGDDIFSGKVEVIEIGHISQKESICFTAKRTLVIADERVGIDGGNLYELKL